MKVNDLVRVKQGAFVTPSWYAVQQDDPEGPLYVMIDGLPYVLDVDVTVHRLREVPIKVTVELPAETSWWFNDGTASITPDPMGAMITMGPVGGPIDWIDVERAALTLLAILQLRPKDE